MLHNFILKQDCHKACGLCSEFFCNLDCIFSFFLSAQAADLNTLPEVGSSTDFCFVFPFQKAKDAMIKLICLFNLHLVIRARRGWKEMPGK